jgi:hypothetical protein
MLYLKGMRMKESVERRNKTIKAENENKEIS